MKCLKNYLQHLWFGSILLLTGGLMRRFILILLFCNAIVFAQDGSGPKIKFEVTNHAYEEVPADTLLEFVFNFQNVGDDTLKILKVRPG